MKIIKSEKDFWSGLLFIVVGVAFAWGATTYSFGGACERGNVGLWECMARASARPGPAYFPFGLGVLMVLLGLMVLFKSLTFEVEGGDKIGPWAWKPLLIIAGAVLVFGWAIPHLGLWVALPLLVIGSALAGDEFHWKDVLINCIVLTVGSWMIFIWGLKLTIPLYPTFLAG